MTVSPAASEVAERPILFSKPMVRALLSGIKAQTRRMVKITHRSPGLAACLEPPHGLEPRPRVAAELCPYGQSGDRLWVREAWRTETDYYNDLSPSQMGGEETILYEADAAWGENKTTGRLRASIHMPRWASRILLEITAVRVERLQEITYEDILAEGVRIGVQNLERAEALSQETKYRLATDAFWALWTSINGKESWNANPWLWVVTFRRLS